MLRHRWLVPCLLVLACAACGKTKQDVIAEYRSRMETRRSDLATIAAKLPAPGAVPDRKVSLSPLPISRYNGSGNTVFLALEQLRDPDAKPSFDFLLGGNLLRCLQWAGPKNPLVSSALRSRADDMANSFEDALNCRYVGVLRTLNYQPPEIVGDKGFRGGALEVEVILTDLMTKEIHTGFRVSARTDSKVTVQFREGENRDSRAEAHVHSTLWSNARKQLAAGLSERTGGTFGMEP